MGFAAGFQTGAQAVERGIKLREDEQLKQQLADVYKAPSSGLTYTSDQMADMRQKQASGSYDIEAVPGAEGQAPTLRYTPKQGLDYGDLGPAAPTEYAPQQVQIYGGRSVAGEFDPNVLQGLQARRAAQVVGASGDFRGAAQLQAEALRMEREAVEAPLRLQGLRQQLETGDLTNAEKRRLATEQVNITSAREALASKRKEGPLTAADIADISGQFKLDPTQFLKAEDAVSTQEIKDLKRTLSSSALKGEVGLNKFLADKFDPDKTDNTVPKIAKNKDGNFVVMYGDRVLEEYGAHKNMMSMVGGIINIIDQNPFDTLKTLSTLETQAAQRRASDASAAVHSAQANTLIPAQAGLATAQTNYTNNIKGQNPTLLVNDKGEPSPVIMSSLPVVNGVVQLPQGLRFPKDAQQATQLEQRAYESLAKTDAWQRAERKGDQSEMNRLMVGRGLDPAKHGGAPAAADWQVASKPNAARPAPVAAPASAQPVGIQYSNDEDYRQLPYRNVNQGYSTPDARALLRTPVYGSGMQGLKVTD